MATPNIAISGVSAGIAALLWATPPALAAPVASFDYMEYRSLETPVEHDDGSFRNPILSGFHPDPSIVQVDGVFYLVTSTFSWFPGLPIYRSTDLVNWRLVGNAITRAGMLDFSDLGTNRGLFAPAIEHHSGRFWIVNTCIECGGNFVITADQAEGPWSDPQWLDFDGIDPSLYFAADGKAWIVYNDAPPGAPLYEGHRAIWIRQFDTAAMQVVGEPTLLVNGGVDLSQQPVWAEGPHIYKVGEWYYLNTAEGGTADRHSQTIYRSRRITGPYEPGPHNPILTQRDLPADRPDRVEATGHADLVRLEDGTWWGVFLATRPFAGQSTLLGRETFLLPLEWKDGWPVFLEPGEPVPLSVRRPRLPDSSSDDAEGWRDEFEQELSDHWIGIRTHTSTQQSIVDADSGRLVLVPGGDPAGSLGKPAFVGRRLRHSDAEITIEVDFSPEEPGSFAGLLAFMDENHFVAIGVEENRVAIRLRTDNNQASVGALVAEASLVPGRPVELRMRLRGGMAEFAWRSSGESRWRNIGGQVDVEPLASIHAGLFTGLVVGPYAVLGQ